MRGKFRVAAGVLLAVFLICGAAAADIVYTTADFSTYTGELRVIGNDSAVSQSIASVTSDTAVFAFRDGAGKRRIAVVERDYTVGDTVTVCDPADEMTRLFQEKWTGAKNIYSIAASGGMLYAACYAGMGAEGAKVVQVSLSDCKPTGKEYAYPVVDGYYPHATKVLTIGGSVYVLFNREKGNYPNYEYAESKLVKLTADLEYVEAYDVGKNAEDMVSANDGNGIVVAYMGGPQAAGTVGGLDLVHTKEDIAGDRVESLSEGRDWAQMIKGLCYVNTQCLYFIGQRYETAGSLAPVSTLYRWTGTTDAPNPIKEVSDISSSTGYSYQVAFDAKNDKIVTLAGDRILVFNRDDTLKEEFTGVELNGAAYSLTLTDSASGGREDSDDGGSGCNAGLTAFLAVLVLPLALRRKSR
ncbi:MAG: SYNERG-CTERM sorting domain-containing protein [Synergistaceae bacterium]|jgi:Synergist-CTERM protein sorting domain-containing protein|nr:SYNERG-CTERM sorting domain-containing protein [Synergistaceae bacterium]